MQANRYWPHVVGLMLLLAAYNTGVFLLYSRWPIPGYAHHMWNGLTGPVTVLTVFPLFSLFPASFLIAVGLFLSHCFPTTFPRVFRILFCYLVVAACWLWCAAVWDALGEL